MLKDVKYGVLLQLLMKGLFNLFTSTLYYARLMFCLGVELIQTSLDPEAMCPSPEQRAVTPTSRKSLPCFQTKKRKKNNDKKVNSQIAVKIYPFALRRTGPSRFVSDVAALPLYITLIHYAVYY